MALIAPGVCRYSIIGTVDGQDVINVFDYLVDTTGDVNDRPGAINGIAGDIINNWTDHILPGLSASYSALEVRWVDLDDADGTTGSRSSTSNETWPQPGLVSGAVLPNNTCALVVKRLEGKNRQQRNGLTRLGGIPEAFTVPGSGNFLTSDAVTGYTDSLNEFLSGTNDAEGPEIGAQRQMCVVHTVEQVYSGVSGVLDFSCKSNVGTIRRRMPGYGS